MTKEALLDTVDRVAQPTPYYAEHVILGPVVRAESVWLSSYGPDLEEAGGYVLADRTGDVFHYTRRWTSVPVLLCCILLFPVGLLALLARRELVLTVRFEPYGEDTKVVVDGMAVAGLEERLSEAA